VVYLNIGYYPGVLLEGIRNIMKIYRLDLDLHSVPSEYNLLWSALTGVYLMSCTHIVQTQMKSCLHSSVTIPSGVCRWCTEPGPTLTKTYTKKLTSYYRLCLSELCGVLGPIRCPYTEDHYFQNTQVTVTNAIDKVHKRDFINPW